MDRTLTYKPPAAKKEGIKTLPFFAQLLHAGSRVIFFIADILHKIFFSYHEAIFHVDRHRYDKLPDEEFDEFCRVVYGTNFDYGDLASDRSKIRQDVINLFHDFRKAKDEYKREKAVLHGESE